MQVCPTISDILHLYNINLTASSSVSGNARRLAYRAGQLVTQFFICQTYMKKRIERMSRIKAAIKPMYCVPKRSDLSLIGSAFEAAGFRCVRIRTECEAEHRTKGGDPRRHGMLILDGDRVILEISRSKKAECKTAGSAV